MYEYFLFETENVTALVFLMYNVHNYASLFFDFDFTVHVHVVFTINIDYIHELNILVSYTCTYMYVYLHSLLNMYIIYMYNYVVTRSLYPCYSCRVLKSV